MNHNINLLNPSMIFSKSTIFMTPKKSAKHADIFSSIDSLSNNEELSTEDDDDARSQISSLDTQKRANQQQPFRVDKTKFKTEMCKNWMTIGKCPYKKKCQFAHGSEELVRKDVPENFKTKKCNSFHINHYCPYGTRCQFIHNDPKRLLKNKFLPKYQIKLKALTEEILKDNDSSKKTNQVKTSRLPIFQEICKDDAETKKAVYHENLFDKENFPKLSKTEEIKSSNAITSRILKRQNPEAPLLI